MNEIKFRLLKGGQILTTTASNSKVDKLHHLIKQSDLGAYFKPLLKHLLGDYQTYGSDKVIRLFYKDDVLLDYLLTNEEIELSNGETLMPSTILHTYYKILKMDNPNLNHKTLLFNTFLELSEINSYAVSKDWNSSRQYTNDIKLGKQNISNNLKVKIADYFKFDVKLFEEDYFNQKER